MDDKINYEELLIKYIARVIESEGVSFIGGSGLSSDSEKFNEGEIKALQDAEIKAYEIIK